MYQEHTDGLSHLDICAGAGRYGASLAGALGPVRHAVSVDTNQRALGISHTYRTDVWDSHQRGYFRHTRIVQDVRSLSAQYLGAIPLVPTSFDQVSWCFPSAEALTQKRHIVSAVRQLLKPGGLFILRSAVPWTKTPAHLENAGLELGERLELAQHGFAYAQSAGQWLTTGELALHTTSQTHHDMSAFECAFRVAD